MSLEVLPLVGYKSLRALNAFNVLLLGLKMLPSYIGEGYETFFEAFKEKTDAEKEKLLKEAVLFVELDQSEVEALITFCKDPNGVPYGPSNLRNLTAEKIHEIIVAVCMEIGKIKIDLLTEDEKKKSISSR